MNSSNLRYITHLNKLLFIHTSKKNIGKPDTNTWAKTAINLKNQIEKLESQLKQPRTVGDYIQVSFKKFN